MTYIDRIFQNESLIVLKNKIYKLSSINCPSFKRDYLMDDFKPVREFNGHRERFEYIYPSLKIGDRFYECDLMQEIELQQKHPLVIDNQLYEKKD